jgi:hypothetical protein
VSNRTRHHRRPRRRAGTRIRGLAWVDLPDALQLLDGCDCPALIIPGDPVVIEHQHRHACPELKRWSA